MRNFKGKKNYFTKDKKYNSIGITLNALNYFGDLSPNSNVGSTDIGFTRPGIGVDFSHRFGPRYTLRASFLYGTIRGDDFESAEKGDSEAKYRYARNLSFRNRIKELTVVAVFDLFKNEASYISRVQWTPYTYIGATIFHHNPQAYVADDSGLPEAGTWVDLQPLGTEGQNADLEPTDANAGIEPYKLVQFAIPFGIGVRYRLNQVFDLSFEMGIRYTFTDYLDDVSQNYVDLGVFGDDDLARYLSDRSTNTSGAEGGSRNIEAEGFNTTTYQGRDGNNYTVVAGFGQEFRDNNRGNKDNNDVYFVTSIRVAYIIGATFTRAKFR
ncbi:DUF6089 family protein [Fulvivirga lutea]|uniref:DUF6089 domain-containing protein n=1 Tax=Fulvivirga lutea TaxID=2810512 RepID=A0A974WK16_9BACT|nr:DUF6089 family protein [Fulvivirga lutea]QSE98582.1 hypothetical protein JR347_05745 [Fulvivirga lutea]